MTSSPSCATGVGEYAGEDNGRRNDQKPRSDLLSFRARNAEGRSNVMEGEVARGTLMPGNALRAALVRPVECAFPWVASRLAFSA